MEPTELILLPSLKAHRGPRGGLVLTQKYLDGAAEYARFWPGPVTSLVEVQAEITTDMDHVEVLPGEGETGLEHRPVDEKALSERLQSAAVVLGFLAPGELDTARLCDRIGVPIVFTSEYSPRTERQIIDAEVSNPLIRWRRKLWARNAEKTRLCMLPMAAGVQCSGTPTYDIYSKVQDNALLFFDNRVRQNDVISDEELVAKTTRISRGEPLRLIFGGRLVGMKGAMDLPAVAGVLKDMNVPFTLDIFGSGPQENEIRTRIEETGLDDLVRLRGVLDFRSGWIPHLKAEADLFVCCHLQGDPSSTYPEVMSCGMPIVGYDNEAFAGVVRHSGAGFLSPMHDVTDLAGQIAELHRNRDRLVDAAVRARDFARQHTFEKTFARRIDHLIKASRLPQDRRGTVAGL